MIAGWQDTIQAETQSRDIAGQGNIDRLLSEGGRLAVEESLKSDRGGVARAFWPPARIAGLPLGEAVSLFFACFFRCHQTSIPQANEQTGTLLRKDVPKANYTVVWIFASNGS
jgi:hypothetical protein